MVRIAPQSLTTKPSNSYSSLKSTNSKIIFYYFSFIVQLFEEKIYLHKLAHLIALKLHIILTPRVSRIHDSNVGKRISTIS